MSLYKAYSSPINSVFGKNIHDIRMFKGINKLQYGNNIRVVQGKSLGGVFKNFFKFIAPIIKSSRPIVKKAAKAVSKEILEGGVEILRDMDKGVSMKTLVEQQTNKRLNNISERAIQELNKNLTSGGNIRRKKSVALKPTAIKTRNPSISPFIKGIVVKRNKPAVENKIAIKKF